MSFIFVPPVQHHYVYAMVCRDENGPVYVKFGHSGSIAKRLSSLRTACPIPAKWFLTLRLNSRELALRVEKELHKQFKSRKTKGEWFKFDLSSEDDKKEFHAGKSLACKIALGTKARWDKISVAALDKYNGEKRAIFLNSKNRREIQKKLDFQRRSKQAQRELANYGT